MRWRTRQTDPDPEVGQVVAHSPFANDNTPRQVSKRASDFLIRTGLEDYAKYIRQGTFLARRRFGQSQVEYLEEEYMKEDKGFEDRRRRQHKGAANASKDRLRDVNAGPIATDENIRLRRDYEKEQFAKEGDRGRWQIFFRQSWRVHALILCCSLGAVIQGWDETAINGALLYYPAALDIVDRHEIIGLINAAPYLMCIFSCCLTEPLNRFYGRRGAIMFCCIFCFASCLGQAYCRTWQELLACRLLLGFGIGPKSATIPIYAAESVPSEEIRGALVMAWQMYTALGIMLGLAVSYGFKDGVPGNQWRFMIGSPMVAPIVLFFLMMAQPESPRWHILKARRLERRRQPDRLRIEPRYEDAFQSLRQLRNCKAQAGRDLIIIDAWITMEQSGERPGGPQENDARRQIVKHNPWRAWLRNSKILFTNHRCRQGMKAGLIVMALQQLCGVNVLAYYSSSVFKRAISCKMDDTFTDCDRKANNDALLYSLCFGAINFGIAIPAAFLIDKVGRRLLLLATLPFMALLQLAIGLSFRADGYRQRLIVAWAYLFCLAYSIGEGPVPLVYASECLPLEVRDTGVGLLTGVYWGLNSLMALTWPQMLKSFREAGSFGFYALMNLIGLFLVIMYVPETSRYQLEELDNVFEKTTKEIQNVGWGQMKWLITLGWIWKHKYPELVPRMADAQEPVYLNELNGSSEDLSIIQENRV